MHLKSTVSILGEELANELGTGFIVQPLEFCLLRGMQAKQNKVSASDRDLSGF